MNKRRKTCAALKTIMSVNAAMKREKVALDKLAQLKTTLTRAVEDIAEVQRTKQTGWFVLLRRDGEGWKCLGTFNPDLSPEYTEPEWDLALPIPDPTTIPEFQGW
jgi:hypothetical protein